MQATIGERASRIVGAGGTRATPLPVVSGAPKLHSSALLPRRHLPTRPHVICAASKDNLYDILGVPQSASERDIKSAYRKKALKLHPDVNKAPDAQQRFMEAKRAFETLSDTKMRSEYDRRLRMGFGSSADWQANRGAGSSSGGWGSYGSYGSSGSRKRPASEPEDNYTFEDLMRDLDKEVSSWLNSRESKDGGKPKSLIEELAMLGEELVDFLEDTVGVKDSGSKSSSSSSSGSTSSSDSIRESGGKRSSVEEFEELWNKVIDPLTKQQSSSSAGTSGSSSAGNYSSSSSNGRASSSNTTSSSSNATSSKSKEDDIDAMLAELKRKVKKT